MTLFEFLRRFVGEFCRSLTPVEIISLSIIVVVWSFVLGRHSGFEQGINIGFALGGGQ